MVVGLTPLPLPMVATQKWSGDRFATRPVSGGCGGYPATGLTHDAEGCSQGSLKFSPPSSMLPISGALVFGHAVFPLGFRAGFQKPCLRCPICKNPLYCQRNLLNRPPSPNLCFNMPPTFKSWACGCQVNFSNCRDTPPLLSP